MLLFCYYFFICDKCFAYKYFKIVSKDTAALVAHYGGVGMEYLHTFIISALDGPQ
jgi:hypothetical protein